MMERELSLANNGSQKNMFRVAVFYSQGMYGLKQDKAKGIEWYQRAMEAGSGSAACNLGLAHFNGDGVERDHNKAFRLLMQAIDMGSVIAHEAIGELFMVYGKVEKGILHYRKAAICGLSNPHIFGNLRNAFREGL